MNPLLEITLRTLAIGAGATLVELPLAVLLARWLARSRFPGRSLLQALLVLPMFLPPVAVGLLLLLALAPGGVLAFLGPPLLYRQGAAALAAGVIAFPLLLRHAEEAFAAVPERLLQVAATLGASRTRTFFRVELPLARRGLAVGVLLAFARGVGEYGATSVVAGVIPGSTETLATGIGRRLAVGDDAGATTLALVSVGIGLAAVFLGEWLLRPGRRKR